MQLPAGSRNGYKAYHYADGQEDEFAGRLWWLLPGRVDPDQAVAMCQAWEYYGGVGRAFADRPRVRSTGTRTLVVQRVGIDA